MGLFNFSPAGVAGTATGFGALGYMGGNAAVPNSSWSDPFGKKPALYDAGGMPNAPTFQGEGNAKLATDALAQIGNNRSALNQFQNEAMRQGPSAWAGLANAQQNAEQGIGKDRARKESMSGAAGANAALAMRGGSSAGARERIQNAGAKNYMDMSQQAAQQAGQNRMQIGVNDEANRIQQLGMAPGMQNQADTFDMNKVNAANAARWQEANSRNQFNANTYQNQMQNFGAAQSANAIAGSGKK